MASLRRMEGKVREAIGRVGGGYDGDVEEKIQAAIGRVWSESVPAMTKVEND